MHSIPKTARPVIKEFAPAFTRPTLVRFAFLLFAAILTTGHRTVTNVLRTLGRAVPGHPSSYHRVFSHRRWYSWKLARGLATFILDLLCIHPFRDGNGRVSRLATSLLLQSQGFQVARYISLERLIEESKEEYYRVLNLCSQSWHEGRNEIVPWWDYFLSTLRGAYKEFEHQVESVGARPAKSDMVRQTVLGQAEPFTLGDMAAQLPAASSQLIKKVLAEMKKAGQTRLVGRGRGARWEVIR